MGSVPRLSRLFPLLEGCGFAPRRGSEGTAAEWEITSARDSSWTSAADSPSAPPGSARLSNRLSRSPWPAPPIKRWKLSAQQEKKRFTQEAHSLPRRQPMAQRTRPDFPLWTILARLLMPRSRPERDQVCACRRGEIRRSNKLRAQARRQRFSSGFCVPKCLCFRPYDRVIMNCDFCAPKCARILRSHSFHTHDLAAGFLMAAHGSLHIRTRY
jgi:hypothetical protein